MQQTSTDPGTTNGKAPDPIYILRDNMVRDFQPKGELEMMLVTQIAQSWVRLQRAHDAETRLFAGSDPLTVMKTDAEIFTRVSRYITACERSWRKAIEELRRAQRSRLAPHVSLELGPQRPQRTYPPPAPVEAGSAPQLRVPAQKSPVSSVPPALSSAPHSCSSPVISAGCSSQPSRRAD